MKIEQITRADHARRVETWHQKAVNDPVVRPFLGMGLWRSVPAAADDDWSKGYFMDENDRGLLAVTFDHVQHSAGLGLWVLGGNPGIAGLLMRFAICTLPRRNGLTHLTFCISDSNKAWRDQIMGVAGQWMWGREPASVYDTETATMVDCLHFKVPIAAIQKMRTDRRAPQERQHGK